MRPEQKVFLELPTLPARLTTEQAAWCLGFQPSEIPILVATKLLKPLGHPPASGPKYFAAVVLTELRNDSAWLDKASDAVVKFWRTKNAARKAHFPPQPLFNSAG